MALVPDTPDTAGDLRVGDLSEAQLLARIVPLLPQVPGTSVGPGDDAAVVSAPDGRFAVSTDVLVEGHHFRLDWSGGYDVGWRAAEQNLADVAAMGASPTALVVALVLPSGLEVSWLLDLVRGLSDACARVGASVVGGDLSAGESVVVAVTVHGDLAGGAPVLRSGARPGDEVAHVGVLGRSAAGLALLEAGRADLDPELVAAFRRPIAPLRAGVAARLAGATAMLDVSDGLVLDASRIADASGVGIRLRDPRETAGSDVERLTRAARAIGGLSGRDEAEGSGGAEAGVALEWVLAGGEDHGLLATFPPGSVPDGFRVLGQVVERGARPVVVDGVELGELAGWDHFDHRG